MSRRGRDRLQAWDESVFREVAEYQSPTLDRLLPAVTRAADHSALWLSMAAVLAAAGDRQARRAACRGLVAVALSSPLVNILGKRAMPRDRPALQDVPVARLAARIPKSGSFPSGHASSAAAFTVGASLELPALAAPLGAAAAIVCASRIYTGVHYLSDVVVGAGIGAGIALSTSLIVPRCAGR